MQSSKISENDRLVMQAIISLGAGAYGVAIFDHIKRSARKRPCLATVYSSIYRLAAKKLLASRLSEPTPERGGRAKLLYSLTNAGYAVLAPQTSALAPRMGRADIARDTV